MADAAQSLQQQARLKQDEDLQQSPTDLQRWLDDVKRMMPQQSDVSTDHSQDNQVGLQQPAMYSVVLEQQSNI